MYVWLVKCEPAKEAGDFSNQPAFFQICRLKAGSRLPWKALVIIIKVSRFQSFNKQYCFKPFGHGGGV